MSELELNFYASYGTTTKTVSDNTSQTTDAQKTVGRNKDTTLYFHPRSKNYCLTPTTYNG